MSYNSSSSGSSQRSFLKRVLRSDESAKATQSNVNTRHPGFKMSSDRSVPGNPLRPEVVMSSAVRQVNKDGFIVYNVPESQEVYVTMPSEEAFFDDEEPRMVHMQPNSFVGSDQTRSTDSNTLPKFANVVRSTPQYSQAADIFANARRRDEFEDIDYSEVIIKSNDNFDKEIEESESFMQKVMRSSRVETPASTIEMADSFSAEAEPEMFNIPMQETVEKYAEPLHAEAEPEYINAYAGFTEEAPVAEFEEEYIEATEVYRAPSNSFSDAPLISESEEIESEGTYSEAGFGIDKAFSFMESEVYDVSMDSFVEEPVMAEEIVEDGPEYIDMTPFGLYVEGNAPISGAEVGVDAEDDMSSIVNRGEFTEAALTSEVVSEPMGWNMNTVVPEERFEVTDITSEATEASAPKIFEIDDPVADMIKLTIPALYVGEEYLDDVNDVEMAIPEDGLERYDAVFVTIKPLSGPISTSDTSGFGINVREEISNTLSMNFRQ